MNGLSDAAQRVADHARSFVDLEVKLATAELKKKAQAVGTGIGLMAGAAVLAFLALTFALLGAVAGLSTTLAVWESFLIVCGALVVIIGRGVARWRVSPTCAARSRRSGAS